MALAGVADEYTRYKMKKMEYFHCTNPSHNWIEWESVKFSPKTFGGIGKLLYLCRRNLNELPNYATTNEFVSRIGSVGRATHS